MLENNEETLSVEKACEEYTNSVKLTLTLINQQLDEALFQHGESLDELSIKIAARTNFLEKNPTFLSCLLYRRESVKNNPLLELDEIKITLKEHTKRVEEKLEEIEKYHRKLLDLVAENGRDERLIKELQKTDETEDDFHDCKEELEILKTDDEFKVRIEKHAFSETKLPPQGDSPTLFPKIAAEVNRGKPHQDIHGKLMQQLVQTDSLEGFLKLMKRKPGAKKKKLAEKYTGSLWFFSKPEKKKKKPVTPTCKLEVTTSQPAPVTNQEKTRKIKQTLERNRLKCYDLLDDIDQNDVKPIVSEYPRRDNIVPVAHNNSYLHQIMKQNEQTWRKLLQPIQIKKKSTVLSKARRASNLMEYLTAPQHKNFKQQNLIVMPVSVVYDNFPTKDENSRVLITDLTKKLEVSPKISDGMKKTEMLDHLRGLKMKNDTIQKNIQKAINVIEMKMIDLLAAPKQTGDAFTAMEKEITNVLRMMNESEKKNVTFEEAKIEIPKKLEAEKDEVPTISFIKKAAPVTERKSVSVKLEGGDHIKKEDKTQKNETPRIKENIKIEKKGDKVMGRKKETPRVEIKKGDDNMKKEKKEEVRKNETKAEEVIKTSMNDVKKIEIKSKVENSETKTKTDDIKKPQAKTKIDNVKKIETDEAKMKKKSNEKDEDKTKKMASSKERPLKIASSLVEETRKTANIEEGEKLLGQVDSVIKKIDSIYIRFYEDGKNKSTKKESNYKNVLEYFDTINEITRAPIVTEYAYNQIPLSVENCKISYQPRVFHTATIELPEFQIPKKIHNKMVEMEEEEEERHVLTLQAFYILFFSTVFFVLYLDFVV